MIYPLLKATTTNASPNSIDLVKIVSIVNIFARLIKYFNFERQHLF